MFPIINKKETGVNLRRIMDRQGVTAKDVQQYLGLVCGNRKSRVLDTHLVAHSLREQRMYAYYEKMNRLYVA